MYITPWSLAGIAVPVTFISVAIRFFNIGMEQDKCLTAIPGIIWWFGWKTTPISEMNNVLGIDMKMKSLSIGKAFYWYRFTGRCILVGSLFNLQNKKVNYWSHLVCMESFEY